MATYFKFDQFVEDVGLGLHNFNTDDFKVYLSNVAPTVTDTIKSTSSATEITAENNYTAGGNTTTNTWSETGGTGTVAATDVVFTASGGTIGPFRYAVLYNDTQTSPADPLIAWWDYGSNVTLQDGETFTVDFGSDQIFTMA